MPPRFLCALLTLLGLIQPALARTLAVEVEVLHFAGQLSAGELEALLAHPQLRIEAHYQPTRLIDGVTARREKIMPIGSKLFSLGQISTLEGAQIARKRRSLGVTVEDGHAAHTSYRLSALRLVAPLAAAPGRPQPNLEITLFDAPERQGGHESVFLARNAAFELGLRLRYRWSDAQGDYVLAPLSCYGDVVALGQGRYRFRPEQRLLRLYGTTEFGSTGQRIPAGAQRHLLSPPWPAPLTAWRIGDQQLVQLRRDGVLLEAMTLRAERKGEDGCRYMRSYDAGYTDGKLLKLQRSDYGLHTESCEEPKGDGASVEMRWADDGSLSWFMESSRRGSRVWDAFRAGNPACAALGEPTSPPSSAEVGELREEFMHLRAAFLKGKP